MNLRNENSDETTPYPTQSSPENYHFQVFDRIQKRGLSNMERFYRDLLTFISIKQPILYRNEDELQDMENNKISVVRLRRNLAY